VDKTGTLTEGKPRVTKVIVSAGVNESDFVSIVAAIEAQSEHPIAHAIVEAAKQRNVLLGTVEQFDSVTGAGIKGRVSGRDILVGKADLLRSAGVRDIDGLEQQGATLQQEGNTVVYAAFDSHAAGLIAVADPIKSTTVDAVKQLHALGLRVIMMTGDNDRTARAVAARLGIDEVQAGVEPKDKHARVLELKKQGRVVAMAGDGINDAPALASADVGIAMGTGTDVAIESAGITLVKGDLRGIAKAIGAEPKRDAQHPAKPFLRLHLQRARRANSGGAALSFLRSFAQPDYCECRDELQLGVGGWKCIKAQGSKVVK
jgi:Cu+-exporting ATPase